VSLKEYGVMFKTRRRYRKEEGQGLVEYALIILLVAVVVVGGLTLFGSTLNGMFTTIASAP
jgi:pilus assembly protein Flp/PilA